MLTPPEFSSFHHAYVAVLRHIADRPDYHTAGRGKNAWETTNVSFRLTNPCDRTPYLASRRANIVFNHAEALWYLAGRDDLDMIGYYAPRLRSFSADGLRLTGTAYGPRLFAPSGPDGLSQFDRVLDLLRADPDTKRAALLIMRPDELVDPANLDVACTLGLQFMIRGGRLHMTAYLRGNDAVVGLLCDTFSFTLIQEVAARALGMPVGTYTHHVGSMHINVLDVQRVGEMIAEHHQAEHGHGHPIPLLPPGDPFGDIAEVLRHEQALRTNTTRLTPQTVSDVPVAAYWQRVLLLFETYRQIVHHPDEPVDAATLQALHPGHRWLIAHRWPDRMPTTVNAGALR